MVNDEGLYAHDVLNRPGRLSKNFNIKGYGDGSFGDMNNITTQINNYARVTEISEDRKKITYTGKTTGGVCQITGGSFVMIHQNHKSSSEVEHAGKFYLAKVLRDDGTEITLNVALPTPEESIKFRVLSLASLTVKEPSAILKTTSLPFKLIPNSSFLIPN